ncbi:hypothetical protein ACWC8S_14285 [Streptomyces fungicidicus]
MHASGRIDAGRHEHIALAAHELGDRPIVQLQGEDGQDGGLGPADLGEEACERRRVAAQVQRVTHWTVLNSITSATKRPARPVSRCCTSSGPAP